ncbi:MAG: hypothetical protein Ct9H300mP12_14390 [Acidimicrobiales bacterium]|nr:MAG: hypothetical protein Ct9H300mP12_14390 [Acidimicrobiales bacterium]
MTSPRIFPFRDQLPDGENSTTGGTCIAGPDGRWVFEPVRDEIGIVWADLDLKKWHASARTSIRPVTTADPTCSHFWSTAPASPLMPGRAPRSAPGL